MKKNKILEAIKTVILLFLLVYAIYQFFDMYSKNSLFESIGELFIKEDEEEFIIQPSEIMISFGDETYVSIEPNTNQEELIKKHVNDIFDEVFKSNKTFASISDNVLTVLNMKSIILSYDEYNSNLTEELFGITNDKVMKLINKIDEIVIVPASTSKEKTKVYLIDNENVYEAECNTDTIELYGLIDEINLFNQMNIYKLSENESVNNVFNKYVFLPIISNDLKVLSNDKNITISNPFIKETNEEESNIEKYANTFFENPKAKWKIERDSNTTIYGDGEKTITINKDGLVSYSYSSLNESKCKLNDAIKIANDKLNNDYYLSKYLKFSNVYNSDENEYELYYDYYIYGMKIEFSNAIKNKYKIDYPVSVKVTSNEITSFKAVILEISDTNNSEEETEININKDNIKQYEDIIKEFNEMSSNNYIKDMKIGYFINNMYENAKLKWIIKTNNEYYTYFIES